MTVPFIENVCAVALCDNRTNINPAINLKLLNNTLKLLNILFGLMNE
jgi:hypothetical protein